MRVDSQSVEAQLKQALEQRKKKEKPHWTKVHLGIQPENLLAIVFGVALLFTLYIEHCTDFFPPATL